MAIVIEVAVVVMVQVLMAEQSNPGVGYHFDRVRDGLLKSDDSLLALTTLPLPLRLLPNTSCTGTATK